MEIKIKLYILLAFIQLGVIYICLHLLTRHTSWPVFFLRTSHPPNGTLRKAYKTKQCAQTEVNGALKEMIRDEKLRRTQLNCRLVFENNSTELDQAEKVNTIIYSNDVLINSTDECCVYRALRGYYTEDDVSDNERTFPLAFTIVVHADPDQFERLMRLIYRPHNVYCVHVDLKTPDETFRAFAAIVRCLPNVFLTSKREVVIFGGFTILRGHLNCFLDLLTYDWRYLLNYAGNELPLRPNNQLVQILRLYNGSCIIGEKRDLPLDEQREMDRRVLHQWETRVDEEKRTAQIVLMKNRNTPPPCNITVTKGWQHGAFSRQFVTYLLNDVRAQLFLEWSKSTLNAEEHFFASLLNGIDNGHLHAPGAYTGSVANRKYIGRYQVWNGRDCHGKMSHTSCVYGVRALPHIAKSPHIGANKFSLQLSGAAVDCVDWLVNRRSENASLDYLGYYRRVVIGQNT